MFGTIRAVAKRFMERAVGLAWPGGRFMGLIKATLGKIYPRAEYAADWREAALKVEKASSLSELGPRDIPPADLMVPTEYNQKRNYNYVFKFEGKDMITQQPGITYLTVATDELLTMEEAEALAWENANEYMPEFTDLVITPYAITTKR